METGEKFVTIAEDKEVSEITSTTPEIKKLDQTRPKTPQQKRLPKSVAPIPPELRQSAPIAHDKEGSGMTLQSLKEVFLIPFQSKTVFN